MKISENEKIIQILEKILLVTSLGVTSDKSLTDGARLLKLAGFDNQTIATMLGTSPATIRTLTSNLHREVAANRKRGKKS